MRNIFYIFLFTFLFLEIGSSFAYEQGSSKQMSCENNLDISALPQYTPLLKENLAGLEDYFTCEAAMKEDIHKCDILSEYPAKMANCKDGFNKYYAIYGKLYKNGHMTDDLLEQCIKKFGSKNACDQLGEVLLSGRGDDCNLIEGITPKHLEQCKEIVSSNPDSSGDVFMMILRKGDPALCDKIGVSSAEVICKGLLNKKVDGCQLNAGADRFKKVYCQHLST